MDYHGHLQNTIQQFSTAEEAILDCKRRFKNLPERHFKSVEALVREYFGQKSRRVPQPGKELPATPIDRRLLVRFRLLADEIQNGQVCAADSRALGAQTNHDSAISLLSSMIAHKVLS